MTDKATLTTYITCALGGVWSVMTFERWLSLIIAVVTVATAWHSWRHRNRMYELAKAKEDEPDEHETLSQ